MDKIKVIAVTGPTASGKTGLAIEIAKAFGGEVVSADSMQIYKGMDIATAKPTADEMQGIPHHLIDFVDTADTYSVAQYVEDSKRCISDISARGKVPVVAGGTGLYVDSLLSGIDFGFVPDNTEVRKQLKEQAEKEGSAVLFEKLKEIDPETASKLHENNEGRIIRALEVYYLTGETLTQQKIKSRQNGSDYDVLYICIEYLDRQKLYDRIEKRVDLMVRAGLLDEAKAYIDLADESTAKQAIGYKELKPYFYGEMTLDEALDNLKKETRHYAKRQLTWFRRHEERFCVYPDAQEDFIKIAKEKVGEFLEG
ncbi:MAG: tRNA (adenosine(37)-N6)-dimethylallyltransferase MiaA [Clostridia bacterium]|nr:tRNA (adenosine(37)-N6)-dimethylallyltransferase MiaA [Clostridia bacterium]